MSMSTVAARLLASPFASTLLDLVVEMLPVVLKIGKRIVAFRSGDITPVTTCAFEKDLADLLRQAGRVTVSWTYNRLETAKVEEAPPLAELDGERYRRRTRHAVRRHCLVSDWL